MSRLKPNVSEQMISTYIKSKIPNLSDNDFALRMLVKKDQNLDDLTFISYRLSCTDEHFTSMLDSFFWPSHVMIGEFIERDRKKQNSSGDFLVTSQPANGETNATESMEFSSIQTSPSASQTSVQTPLPTSPSLTQILTETSSTQLCTPTTTKSLNHQ